MKKTYNAPKLSVHGSLESLTQIKNGDLKKVGTNDGIFTAIDGSGITIGSI